MVHHLPILSSHKNFKPSRLPCLEWTDGLDEGKRLSLPWTVQTMTHVCLITDFCPGGELFLVLERQPTKFFREETARYCPQDFLVMRWSLHVLNFVVFLLLACLLAESGECLNVYCFLRTLSCRFYAAEVVLALEYLHCMGTCSIHFTFFRHQKVRMESLTGKRNIALWLLLWILVPVFICCYFITLGLNKSSNWARPSSQSEEQSEGCKKGVANEYYVVLQVWFTET